MAVEWEISRLNDNHEWDEFSCGEPVLDSFLQKHAEENDLRGVSRLWVATRPGDCKIAGYYASAAGILRREDLPGEMRAGLPGYPLPIVHMARLAVDTTCQRAGLGETLLFHFLRMAIEVAARVGVYAVDVKAKIERARTYYQEYGFVPIPDNHLHLIMTMDTVIAVFSA